MLDLGDHEPLHPKGIRHEEFLEITHLTLVSYRLADTGEFVPLLQILLSKEEPGTVAAGRAVVCIRARSRLLGTLTSFWMVSVSGGRRHQCAAGLFRRGWRPRSEEPGVTA